MLEQNRYWHTAVCFKDSCKWSHQIVIIWNMCNKKHMPWNFWPELIYWWMYFIHLQLNASQHFLLFAAVSSQEVYHCGFRVQLESANSESNSQHEAPENPCVGPVNCKEKCPTNDLLIQVSLSSILSPQVGSMFPCLHFKMLCSNDVHKYVKQWWAQIVQKVFS